MRSQPQAGWPRLAFVACLILGTASAAAAQSKVNRNPIESPEVRRLELRGVKSVDPLDLERSIASVATACRNALYTPLCLLFSHNNTLMRKQYLDRDEIARDILRIRVYYWKHGF